MVWRDTSGHAFAIEDLKCGHSFVVQTRITLAKNDSRIPFRERKHRSGSTPKENRLPANRRAGPDPWKFPVCSAVRHSNRTQLRHFDRLQLELKSRFQRGAKDFINGPYTSWKILSSTRTLDYLQN
ncbi:uncharacterized protein LOC143147317 [Ptiloglossa arizonensis]|uniref:uncharacterized protein LOC143147317 n=1 Tax=Ptiloglossa arizonensis TaxID=3350558 RepID=UPI003F9FA132